jgi:hypothetical protein
MNGIAACCQVVGELLGGSRVQWVDKAVSRRAAGCRADPVFLPLYLSRDNVYKEGASTVSKMLEAMADALEAAAAVLRRRAATGHPDAFRTRHTGTLTERARQIHRMLGERQEQMLPLLAAAGEHGATAGDIARALEYDPANAMITLNAMVRAGLLLKDESAVPYLFRLVPELLAGTDTADSGHGER